MKAWRFVIGMAVLLAMTACHSPQREAKASEPLPELVEDAETPDSALAAIDSLV